MTRQRILSGPLEPTLIPATSRWLQALGAEFDLLADDLYRMEISLGELVANVVNHTDPACAGQLVEMQAQIEREVITLTLVDPAMAFNPLSQPEPRVAQDIQELQIGGLGIHLVRRFSDACRYERCADKNRMELVFQLARPVAGLSPAAPAGPEPSWYPSAQMFWGVPYAELQGLLDPLPIQDIAGEMVLLRPGEPNATVWVLLEGRMRIYLDRLQGDEFIEVGIGTCVGEMSVNDNHPVSAYVVAQPGARLLLIDADTFLHRFMAMSRVSRNLLSALSERMRRSDELTIRRMRRLMEMEQTQRELQYARSIQASLLPREPLFAGDSRLDCVGRMDTAREVGGDFYDIFHLDARHLFFVIADVCGKGLPAALFMVRAIAALRAQSMHEEKTESYAEHLIDHLNQQLCGYNDAQQFLTAFCGILDLQTLRLRYVNAGHTPPLLSLGGGAFQFVSEPINPIVGMLDELSFRAGEIQLLPGSALLLYTDGVTEAEDHQGNMLGEDRLVACLDAVAGQPAGQLVEAVFGAVRAFAGDAPQSDDITLLAVRCPAA